MKTDFVAEQASSLDIVAGLHPGDAATGALPTPRTPCQTAARQALQRVLESRCFAKTTRLSAFLKYVCIAALEGRGATLTEHHIGQHVFNRPAIYNPAEDTIVRTTARLLRLRLTEYYATEGLQERLRITVPRGGYMPIFEDAAPAPPAPPRCPATNDMSADAVACVPAPLGANAGLRRLFARLSARLASKNRPAPWRRWVLTAGIALSVCTALWRHGPPTSPSDSLWSALLQGDRDTLLVPADSNLVLYQLNALREVSLDDYIAKRFGTDSVAPELKSFRNRHTSVSAVSIALELGKRAGHAAADRLSMRYARDLQWSDLKQANLILFGVRQSNPWVEPFRNRFNFHIDWDISTEKFLVRNDRPAPGELAQYEYSKSDPAKRGYAYVAYTRGLTGKGHVLLIQGTTAPGAEAAEDFALDSHRLDAVIQAATSSDRGVGDFEVLLECVMQAGGSSDVRVIATRVHPLA